MQIRLAVPDDAAAIAELRRTVCPYLVASAEQFRRSLAEPSPGERSAYWVAEQDGAVVGYATAGLNTWTSEAGVGQLNVWVHPDRCGRGTGAALLAEAERHAVEIGVRRVQAFVRSESYGFARARGYERNREMHYASTDPRQVPPVPPVPDGVTLCPISEVDPRLVYDADMAATQDEPSDAPLDGIGYDEWVHDVWESPMMRHVVASTSNDDVNAPMLAVNDWLGYRRVATHIGCTRDLH